MGSHQKWWLTTISIVFPGSQTVSVYRAIKIPSHLHYFHYADDESLSQCSLCKMGNASVPNPIPAFIFIINGKYSLCFPVVPLSSWVLSCMKGFACWKIFTFVAAAFQNCTLVASLVCMQFIVQAGTTPTWHARTAIIGWNKSVLESFCWGWGGYLLQ